MEPTAVKPKYKLTIPAQWVRVAMVKDANAPYILINSSWSIYELLTGYFAERDREEFLVICLDRQNRVTALHTASVGSLTCVHVHPRKIFKIAVLSNSDAVLFAHNHPSGNPKPSCEDHQITQRLISAGDILGIRVFDHLIFGDHRYYSFYDEGTLSGELKVRPHRRRRGAKKKCVANSSIHP